MTLLIYNVLKNQSSKFRCWKITFVDAIVGFNISIHFVESGSIGIGGGICTVGQADVRVDLVVGEHVGVDEGNVGKCTTGGGERKMGAEVVGEDVVGVIVGIVVAPIVDAVMGNEVVVVR